MFSIIKARFHQGKRTIPYPDGAIPALPPLFAGLPTIKKGECRSECTECIEACPYDAIQRRGENPVIDLGLCLFCRECAGACPNQVIEFTGEHRLASSSRESLITSGELPSAPRISDEIFRVLGRALKLRQVSAGGCNACEADANVLTTIGWDLSRFGIQFVASPRHADGLLVTGPVTRNMRLALEKTYAAVPHPKIVIASGACAVGGGPYRHLPAVHNGVEGILPVDVYVPGCPPHPLTLLDALLSVIRRIKRD